MKHSPRKFAVQRISGHVITVTDLQYDLMEGFLLLAGANLLVAVGNHPVCAGLLPVAAGKRFAEQVAGDILHSHSIVAASKYIMSRLSSCYLVHILS